MSAHSKRMVRAAKIAAAYRVSQGLPTGGIVILWRLKATGWSHDLSQPHRFAPGALGVTEHGTVFEATGGDYWKGATEWSAIFDPMPIPTAPHD
jgi:hypothetical protein